MNVAGIEGNQMDRMLEAGEIGQIGGIDAGALAEAALAIETFGGG
jgi:hypothetical protein